MVKNNRFDQRIASIPSEIWSKIAQIDELKGQWVAGARLSPQVLGRLKRSVLITSTGASTRIEGAKLSDEDVEKLMRGIDIQKFTDRDKQEVKGYYELLENIFDSWKNLRFNESAIKHFHKELLKYVKKDEPHRGEYKKIENKVEMIDAAGKSVGTLFDTTPAYLTSKETQELVNWTKEGYLHMPYVSHEKLVEDNKPEYYLALRQSQKTFKTDKGTIVPWLDFFLTIFLKQSRMAVELLSKKNIEKLLSKKQLSVWQYLQEADEATPGEIAKRAKVARPTVSQALDKLLRLKKVERIGLGRGTRYRKL